MNLRFHFIMLFGLLAACNGSSDPSYTDTATSGSITISADESLKPIVDAELEVFHSIYPAANIRVIYTNEYDAIDLMCRDSARIAIVTRGLLPEEKARFEKDKITPRYSPFAYDAIAVLVNREIKDSLFGMDQIAGMLTGKIKTWKDLNPASSPTPLQIVFDDARSGITRYCQDSVISGQKLSSNCFAVHGNAGVITRVEEDKNTIGLIGVAWISDQDDSLARGFTQRVRVASLIPRVENPESPSMKPWQAYIALKQYPLWREVQIISREARVGLGTGFASFIASDKGQRIVLKSGLVPAKAPVRLIQINHQNL